MMTHTKAAGWEGQLTATRKTTPGTLLKDILLLTKYVSGFHIVERYAMLIGGASSHGMDLSSLVILMVSYISLLH